MRTKSQQNDADSTKKNLLAADITSLDTDSSNAESIWLVLSTKKFMTNERRLKPRKIALPHSLNVSPNINICLITPDPQRTFKDAISHPSFPTELSHRITKVIGIEKLTKKYHEFESKRQLRDSFDLFLADDRIITYLTKILGKTFYKSTSKRPIPVRLEASKPKEKKNAALPSTKTRSESSSSKSIAALPIIAKEIERTLSAAQVHLSPSTTTSVKIGLASFTPEQMVANVEAVVAGLTDKLVAWRNVRAIHVKGPNTMALPIWLADELWTDEGMVIEDDKVEEVKLKTVQTSKKRKMIGAAPSQVQEASVTSKKRKEIDDTSKETDSGKKKARKVEDEDLSREMKERREKLRQQKREAREKSERESALDAQSSVKGSSQPKEKREPRITSDVQSTVKGVTHSKKKKVKPGVESA